MSKKQTTSLKNMVDRERHRVAATVTQEGQWPQSEPNQGLARMFVIMLLVHVVIIGGIIVYDFFGDGGDAKSANLTAKANATKSETKVKKTESHLPTVAETAPESVVTNPAASPESLLPEAFKSIPTDNIADADVPKAQAFVPATGVSMLAAKFSESEQPKSNLSIVSLPPAPKEETKTIITSTESAVKHDLPKRESPKAETPKQEALRAKPVLKEESRRAVMIGGSNAKPVPTPSAARKSLDTDKRNASAPVAKRKVEDTPPAPKKTDSSVATKKTSKGATVAGKHTVGKGDTLWSIARKYKTTPDAIIKANSIKNPDMLPDGKVLTVPGK